MTRATKPAAAESNVTFPADETVILSRGVRCNLSRHLSHLVPKGYELDDLLDQAEEQLQAHVFLAKYDGPVRPRKKPEKKSGEQAGKKKRERQRNPADAVRHHLEAATDAIAKFDVRMAQRFFRYLADSSSEEHRIELKEAAGQKVYQSTLKNLVSALDKAKGRASQIRGDQTNFVDAQLFLALANIWPEPFEWISPAFRAAATNKKLGGTVFISKVVEAARSAGKKDNIGALAGLYLFNSRRMSQIANDRAKRPGQRSERSGGRTHKSQTSSLVEINRQIWS